MTRTVELEVMPTREKITKRANKQPVASRNESKAWDHGKRERKVNHRCLKLNNFLTDE